jgi:hypothetical protein
MGIGINGCCVQFMGLSSCGLVFLGTIGAFVGIITMWDRRVVEKIVCGGILCGLLL